MFTGHESSDMNGLVQNTITLWGEWFVVNRNIYRLGERVDSDGSGVDENPSLSTVPVTKSIKCNQPGGCDTAQREQPKNVAAIA